MYYTPKERLEIGRRVFAHALTKEEAAKKCGVTIPCIVNYVKEYMKENGIKPIPEALYLIYLNICDIMISAVTRFI